MCYIVDFYFEDGEKQSFIYYFISNFELSIEISRLLHNFEKFQYFVVKIHELGKKELEV